MIVLSTYRVCALYRTPVVIMYLALSPAPYYSLYIMRQTENGHASILHPLRYIKQKIRCWGRGYHVLWS